MKPNGLQEIGTDWGLVAARGIRRVTLTLGCTHADAACNFFHLLGVQLLGSTV